MLKKSNKDTVLYFKGHLDYDVIGDLIHNLKLKMKSRAVRFGLYKKILTLMIEILENIIRYDENYMDNDFILQNYPPEFQIFLENGYYIIESSNAILKKDADNLTSKIKNLNRLDKKDIKTLYKETITNGKFSSKGGAGLGMIEMAKIADRKFEYSFSEVDTDYTYFLLRLAIKEVNTTTNKIEY
jgi:hypothetical protein